VQLTIAQRVLLNGAVVVSTPQNLSLVDARRGITMFRKVNVPILGLVENMSYFKCDGCEKKHFLFGKEGTKKMAEEMGETFLGEIPFDPVIRETTDGGKPVVISQMDSPSSEVYMKLSKSIMEKVKKESDVDISFE